MNAVAAADPQVYDVIYLTCAGLFGLVLLHRIYQALGSRDVVLTAPGWLVVASFASTATAFTFAAPVVYTHVDAAVGVANVATLVVYVAIIVTSALFDATVRLWVFGQDRDGRLPRVARGVVAYSLVAAALVVLFVAGDTGNEEHPLDFDAQLGARPVITEFVLLYYLGFASAMARVALTASRYARIPGDGWLRRGLRWVCVGAMFALGYCLLKVVAVLGLLAGAPLQPLSTVWAPMSASVGALLMCVGLTMPGWGPRIAGGNRALIARQVRDYRRLYPLWRCMRDADLMEIMEPTQGGLRGWFIRRWPLGDAGFRLTRRVVEIMDGRRTLTEYLTPSPSSLGPTVEARKVQGRITAAREAHLIRFAIDAKLSGAQPPPTSSVTHGSGVDEQPDLNPAEQLRWYLLVAEEFRRLDRLQRADRRCRGAGTSPAPVA